MNRVKQLFNPVYEFDQRSEWVVLFNLLHILVQICQHLLASYHHALIMPYMALLPNEDIDPLDVKVKKYDFEQ